MKDDFFSPGRLLLASVLGGLPAGCFLYRHNARLLGKEKEGNQIFMIGTGLTVAAIVAAFYLHGSLHDELLHAFAPVATLCPFVVAKKFQSTGLKDHIAAGRPLGTYWKAAGLGLFSLAIVLAIILFLTWTTHAT